LPKPGASAVQVSELLSADGQSWNDEVLDSNLLHMDVQAVRRIPLGRRQEDFWAWSRERHDIYSVHSAYRLLVEQEVQERDHGAGVASHSAALNDPHWQRLWRCKVPPKVKVFWWRVSHDFIPCRANLHRRHIEQIDVCGFCGNGEESTYHALTQCTYAINFWEKFKSLTSIKVPKLNPRTWTRDLLDNSCCKDGNREVMLCGMWSLWNSRNDRRHGKSPIEPRLAVEWALEACFHLSAGSQTPEDGRRSPH
jgi:hypothetical protein